MARYFGVPQDDLELGFGDKEVGNFEFAEQEVRLGFVRKVFGERDCKDTATAKYGSMICDIHIEVRMHACFVPPLGDAACASSNVTRCIDTRVLSVLQACFQHSCLLPLEWQLPSSSHPLPGTTSSPTHGHSGPASASHSPSSWSSHAQKQRAEVIQPTSSSSSSSQSVKQSSWAP